METINERLARFVDHIGRSQPNGKGIPEVARKAGLDPNTLRIVLKVGASKPSYDTLSMILGGYPILSADWLMLGNGEMVRGAVAPMTPVIAAPAPDYSTAAGTLETVYLSVLKEQIQDLKADKSRLLDENTSLRDANRVLLGKPSNNPDAASPLVLALPKPAPIGPRFDAPRPLLSVQRRGRSRAAGLLK